MSNKFSYSCPECDYQTIIKEIEDHTFPYGASPNTIYLTIKIPIYKCQNPNCGFQWYDWEAEVIMDAEIEQHKYEQQ